MRLSLIHQQAEEDELYFSYVISLTTIISMVLLVCTGKLTTNKKNFTTRRSSDTHLSDNNSFCWAKTNLSHISTLVWAYWNGFSIVAQTCVGNSILLKVTDFLCPWHWLLADFNIIRNCIQKFVLCHVLSKEIQRLFSYVDRKLMWIILCKFFSAVESSFFSVRWFYERSLLTYHLLVLKK